MSNRRFPNNAFHLIGSGVLQIFYLLLMLFLLYHFACSINCLCRVFVHKTHGCSFRCADHCIKQFSAFSFYLNVLTCPLLYFLLISTSASGDSWFLMLRSAGSSPVTAYVVLLYGDCFLFIETIIDV